MRIVVNKKGLIIALVSVFSVLLIDQIFKIYIKTHYCIGESVNMAGSWFILHFTENNGMAFGMEFAGSFGKILLTLFRIIAAGVIAWYLHKLVKKKANIYLIITISLILAGAVGNIIDCLFYGLIFNEGICHGTIDMAGNIVHEACKHATLFPDGGGYASFLHGKVVDMLYFPIMHTTWPSWMPFWGGDEFTFFAPVFNIADSSITIGVLILLLFQKRLFKKQDEQTDSNVETETGKENIS
jgi:signal peptidase II